jgi:DNA-binding transcriptional LysR family regulator
MHLQPVILEFLALYPEIRLRLMLVDRLVNLVEEHVDAAIRIAELRDSRLIARKLGAVRIVLTASPDYIARRGMPRHPGDLADHDCGFRFDPATHSKSYPATIPIIIRPAFRPLSGHLF